MFSLSTPVFLRHKCQLSFCVLSSSNPLTSSEIRLKDISLFDPTTKLPLSGSLDYPSLNGDPPCTGILKCAVHSTEVIAPSLQKETVDRMFSAEAAITF